MVTDYRGNRRGDAIARTERALSAEDATSWAETALQREAHGVAAWQHQAGTRDSWRSLGYSTSTYELCPFGTGWLLREISRAG